MKALLYWMAVLGFLWALIFPLQSTQGADGTYISNSYRTSANCNGFDYEISWINSHSILEMDDGQKLGRKAQLVRVEGVQILEPDKLFGELSRISQGAEEIRYARITCPYDSIPRGQATLMTIVVAGRELNNPDQEGTKLCPDCYLYIVISIDRAGIWQTYPQIFGKREGKRK